MRNESLLEAEADQHIMGEFITHEGSIEDVEKELEKHIDPVSGYPFYVNIRTGDTFWAYNDNNYIENDVFNTDFSYAAENLNDNPVQLDQEHSEWEIDHTSHSEVGWVLNDTKHTGFNGDSGKDIVAPLSNPISERLLSDIEYENFDKVGKVDDAPLDHKAEYTPFNDEVNLTQLSKDAERMTVITEAEDSNMADNCNNNHIEKGNEYACNSLNTEFDVDELSSYYNEVDIAENECLTARENSRVGRALEQIRVPNDEIQKRRCEEGGRNNEVHVEIEQIKEGDIYRRSSNDSLDKKLIAEVEFISCGADSPPHPLTVEKTINVRLCQEEEDVQQEIDDQELEAANENNNVINRSDEMQMFASLIATQFVDNVLKIGIKRARLYVLEKNSRHIGQIRRSQNKIRAQFSQNRQRLVNRTSPTTYLTEESSSEELEEDNETTGPSSQPLYEEKQTSTCALTRLTKNMDLAVDLNLKTGNLNLNSTDVLDISALIPATKANSTSITSLSLVNSSLSDEAAIELSRFLPNLTSLRKLYLWNNEIQCPGARGISIAVSSLPTLEVLSLSHNPIGPKGIRSLAILISQSTCQLRTLKIGGCISNPSCTRWKTIPDTISQDIQYPGDEGAICLAAALLTPHGCPLESLSYVNAGISGIGARAFAAALFCTPPSLTNLNLSGNVFAERDLTAVDVLEDAVRVATHRLKQITLTSCGLSQDAAERIYSLVGNPFSFPPPSLTWTEQRQLGGKAAALRSWLLDAASKVSFTYPREEQRFSRNREKSVRGALLQELTDAGEDAVTALDIPKDCLVTEVTDTREIDHYKSSPRESRINIIEQEVKVSYDRVKREEEALSDSQKVLSDTLASFNPFEIQELVEASDFASLRRNIMALLGKQKWDDTFRCIRKTPERTVVAATSSNGIVEKLHTFIKIDHIIARLEKPMKDVESQLEMVRQSAVIYKEVMERLENRNLESRRTLFDLARPLDPTISLGGFIDLSQNPKSIVDESNMTVEQRQQLYHDRRQAAEQEKHQKRAWESRRIKKQVRQNKRKKRQEKKPKRGIIEPPGSDSELTMKSIKCAESLLQKLLRFQSHDN